MERHLAAMRLTSLARPIAVLALAAGLSAANAAAPKTPAKARPKTPPVVSSLPAGTKLDGPALARHIDEAIASRIRAEQVSSSPLCDDAEFLRRVYLDITGHIPPAEKATTFLDSREPNKRAKLIDELLAGSDYGKHQADIWQNLLLPRTSDNRFIQFDKMTKWLEANFNENKPWDQMTRAIVTAEGDMDKNGAVLYFLANATPDKLTDNATRSFLGVQLQCAQCHNHPFTEWKQNEYWGMAAFFTKVRFEGNPRQAARQGGTVQVHEGGKGRQVRLPISAKRVPPKFFQGEEPKLSSSDAYRPVLANWMTSPKNPYFSKAMVNRTWAQFFGRGIVNPVDDMHDGNQPSHPQLLADLSSQFAANGFDVKHLIRGICNSETYQRTSKPSAGNRDAGPELFSRMAVKVMTPEQMFDSLGQVLGAPTPGNRPRRQGAAAIRFRNITPRMLFVNFFKGDENADPTEYQAGIPQVLRLMNAPRLNNAAMLTPVLKSGKSQTQIVEHLYLTTLSRRPTPHELDRTLALVRKYHDEPRQAYGDILWALLNSSEFTLNH
ncbi:MAG TPA: DUF1549 and DUF1553 domain-containing protein [Gemmataceae bacterium]|nr:DUF1549 and DUF1553 domain-containing protein [Gemmataceae bacterium]